MISALSDVPRPREGAGEQHPLRRPKPLRPPPPADEVRLLRFASGHLALRFVYTSSRCNYSRFQCVSCVSFPCRMTPFSWARQSSLQPGSQLACLKRLPCAAPSPTRHDHPTRCGRIASRQGFLHLHECLLNTPMPLAALQAQPASPKRQRQQATGQPGSSGGVLIGPQLTAHIQRAETNEQVVRLVQQAGPLCNAFHFSAAVNRLVQLALRDRSLGERCQAAFHQLAQLADSQQLDPWAVAQFIWAAATLWEGVEPKQPFGTQQVAWQHRMGVALADRRCKPQTLANILWGASKLGWQLQGQLAAAAEAAILRLAEQMTSQNVANTLLAYANAGWPLDSEAAAALLQRLEQVVPLAKPQEVANSLWAAAKLGLQLSDSLKAAFSKAIRRIVPTANSHDLANILWACGTLRWSPGGPILPAAVTAMQRLIASGAVKSQEVRNFLWGLAQLQKQGVKLPGDLHALLSAAVDWAGSRWGQLSARDVADLCYNLARLGHQPSKGWIAAALARCGCACVGVQRAGQAARSCDIQSWV